MKPSGIKLLTNFASEDLVTEILGSVTMKTVVFGRAELREPWGLHVDLPGRAVFHIVLRGRCWFRFGGAAPILMTYGDTILFPHACFLNWPRKRRSMAIAYISCRVTQRLPHTAPIDTCAEGNPSLR